jgi:hypothetical protein
MFELRLERVQNGKFWTFAIDKKIRTKPTLCLWRNDLFSVRAEQLLNVFAFGWVGEICC